MDESRRKIHILLNYPASENLNLSNESWGDEESICSVVFVGVIHLNQLIQLVQLVQLLQHLQLVQLNN